MSLAAAAAGMRAGAVGLAGVVVSKVVGGAATTAPDASSPHGFVVHFLDDEDVKSREELMVQALERLRAARAQQTNATLSSPRLAANDRKRLERTSTANDTWLKIYALMDYVSPFWASPQLGSCASADRVCLVPSPAEP
jgi:hypothetical protein